MPRQYIALCHSAETKTKIIPTVSNSRDSCQRFRLLYHNMAKDMLPDWWWKNFITRQGLNFRPIWISPSLGSA